MAVSVVILGSYRKHFGEVSHARTVFRKAGWQVSIPAGEVIDQNEEFVRLTNDNPVASRFVLEDKVIEKALAADIVYFVCPDGYIGRTASYELGRLLQAGRRVYVSHQPADLPVDIPGRQIVTPEELVALHGTR